MYSDFDLNSNVIQFPDDSLKKQSSQKYNSDLIIETEDSSTENSVDLMLVDTNCTSQNTPIDKPASNKF